MAEQSYQVKGMDCADCAVKIEKGVRQVAGVKAARVDFATGLLFIEGDAPTENIRRQVSALGYSLEDRRRAGGEQPNALAGFWKFLLDRGETRLAIAGGALVLLSLALRLAGLPVLYVNLIQVAALAVAGFPIAKSAAANLVINRDFSINLLMTIAAIGAVILGDYLESATLIFLFAVAEALEGYTADRARAVLGDLSSLSPAQATLITPQGEQIVPVEELAVGSAILVRPGERIPMDGSVTAGSSAVNQAPITGESMPVEKGPGSEVFAGTVNGSGALTVQVTRPASETTIQRVIRLIEQSQNLRAPTQRFIDQFARVYTPAVVILAALIAAVPPLLFGQPFFNPAEGGTGWFYRALALLVIACPCALVISAPVTVVSAITAAARQGVLFKGGAYLEALAGVKAFAFDKTGTLTAGSPVVTSVRSVDCADGGTCQACDDVLAIASALEKRSTHPLAHSVVKAAEERGLAQVYAPAEQVTALAGSGLQGQVNGKLATVGNHRLFDLHHPHDQQVCAWVESAEQQGQTAMLVCDGDRVRGFISVADEVRGESREMIASLRRLGKETVMLTGDNPSAAQSVGERVGVSQVKAGLLPHEKVEAVQSLQAQYGPVAMVGDGINDAPALAASSLGIAMGGAGSDQAMETADIVLMGADLSKLPFAVRLSSFTRGLIRQNIAISLATKLVFVILTLFGFTSLWLAVAADMGVSLLVTFNGMRAGKFHG